MDCLNNIWKTKTSPMNIRHSRKWKKNSLVHISAPVSVSRFVAELGINAKVGSSSVVVWFVGITYKQSGDGIIFIHLLYLFDADDSEGLTKVVAYPNNVETYTKYESKKRIKTIKLKNFDDIGWTFYVFFCS